LFNLRLFFCHLQRFLLLGLREVKAVIWLRSRLDYLRLGMLGIHGRGEGVVNRYYQAMERLFLLENIERSQQENTREFLVEINTFERQHLAESVIITRLFEDARHGGKHPDPSEVNRLRAVYRKLYQEMD